jgi:hypothetical protein
MHHSTKQHLAAHSQSDWSCQAALATAATIRITSVELALKGKLSNAPHFIRAAELGAALM